MLKIVGQLTQLNEVVSAGVKVTVLADRDFGSADLYEHHCGLGLDHIIRPRGEITVTDIAGISKPARDWLFPTGRARVLRNVTVTGKHEENPRPFAFQSGPVILQSYPKYETSQTPSVGRINLGRCSMR